MGLDQVEDSCQSPQNKDVESKTVEKIESLGDYPVFGWYFVFVIVMMETLWLPQMSNITFMIYGGYTPIVKSCGNASFTGMTREQSCEILSQIQVEEPCQPVLESEFYSLIQEFGYYCTPEVKSSSISLHMFGLLLGAILYGQFSDLFGRRRMMLIGLFCMIVLGTLSSYATTLFAFNVLQFANLFSTSAVSTIGMIYLMELFPKKHRFWALLVVSFSVNYVILSLMAYLTGEWRLLVKAINVFNIAGFVLMSLATESPRWLVQNGDIQAAKAVYERIERFNGTCSEERQMILDLLIQKEVTLLEEKKKQKTYFFHHLFSTWSLVRFNFVLPLAVFTASVITYSLIFNMEQLSGSIYVNNALLGASRFAINILIGALDLRFRRVGRKLVINVSMAVVISSFLFVFAAQLFDLKLSYLTNAILILALAMNSQIFIIVHVLTGELFPTPIRNVADSLQQVFTRMGAVMAPHVILTTSLIWTDLPFLFMAVLVVVTMILINWAVPETKGNPMSDHMPHKSERFFYKSKIVVVPTVGIESSTVKV